MRADSSVHEHPRRGHGGEGEQRDERGDPETDRNLGEATFRGTLSRPRRGGVVIVPFAAVRAAIVIVVPAVILAHAGGGGVDADLVTSPSSLPSSSRGPPDGEGAGDGVGVAGPWRITGVLGPRSGGAAESVPPTYASTGSVTRSTTAAFSAGVMDRSSLASMGAR